MNDQLRKEIIDSFVPIMKENIGNHITTAVAIGLTDQLSQILQGIINKEILNGGLPGTTS